MPTLRQSDSNHKRPQQNQVANFHDLCRGLSPCIIMN